MAVLVEAISVIVRADAIHSRHPGGWPAFRDEVPNRTLCAADELARVGFMSPPNVQAYVKKLGRRGLLHRRGRKALDLVVVDQVKGPTTECDWVEFGRLAIDGCNVAACRLRGSSLNTLITPEGWEFEGSLSETYGFAPSGQEHKSLCLLRHDRGSDVYLNLLTGKEVYVGRASSKPSDNQAR